MNANNKTRNELSMANVLDLDHSRPASIVFEQPTLELCENTLSSSTPPNRISIGTIGKIQQAANRPKDSNEDTPIYNSTNPFTMAITTPSHFLDDKALVLRFEDQKISNE